MQPRITNPALLIPQAFQAMLALGMHSRMVKNEEER
jgi:hypothetical protein